MNDPFLTEVTLDSQMELNLLESHGHGRVSFGIYVYRQCVLHMVKICVRYFRVRFLWRLAVGKRPQGSDGCLLFRLTDLTRAGFHMERSLCHLVYTNSLKVFCQGIHKMFVQV